MSVRINNSDSVQSFVFPIGQKGGTVSSHLDGNSCCGIHLAHGSKSEAGLTKPDGLQPASATAVRAAIMKKEFNDFFILKKQLHVKITSTR